MPMKQIPAGLVKQPLAGLAKRLFALLTVVFLAGALQPASAQVPEPEAKPHIDAGSLPYFKAAESPRTGMPQPTMDMLLNSQPTFGPLPSDAMPYAPPSTPQTGKPGDPQASSLYLMARLTRDGPLVGTGLVWRVFSQTANKEGRLNLLATAKGGDAEFRLDPGSYLLHTAYGHAGITSKVTVARGQSSQTVVLNAGGLKLDAVVAKTIPLKRNVRFDIYETEFNSRGERKLVMRNVKPGTVVPLNAATYHVVSRYGNVNAQVRADIKVDAGELTEATIYHNAAEVTLKLVNEPGGEAMVNTAWSVLTPGGDTVVEGDGAFPSYVLAAGSYTVIARNQDNIYTREFEVVSGRNGEVEVLARQPVSAALDNAMD